MCENKRQKKRYSVSVVLETLNKSTVVFERSNIFVFNEMRPDNYSQGVIDSGQILIRVRQRQGVCVCVCVFVCVRLT